jgi:hypothetical protein
MSNPRVVLLLFLSAQLCDGLFTYTAVHADGLIAEGNQLLAAWMGLIGVGPALLGAKVMAAVCGVILYARGVHGALALLTLFYAVAAVGPWMIALHYYY